METIVLNFKHIEPFSDEEFYQFCMDNPELKLERSSTGQIIIMANTGGKTGILNAEINFQLKSWDRVHKQGQVFDSSTTFHLPSGADRSPDAAWVENSRWQSLTAEQQTKFPPLCPDFVIELRSESDSLKQVQQKMQEEWIDNGCQLAWLIDPKNEEVYIYRPEQEVEKISGFEGKVSGENILQGFELNLENLKIF